MTGVTKEIAQRREAAAMSTAEPVSVKQRAIAKLRLWFFRDISSEQRRSLFSIFGMPVNEVKKHGDEAHCLQHILAALSHVQAPAEVVAARAKAVKFIIEHDPFGDVFSQHELAQLDGCVIDRVKEAETDVFDDLRNDVQEEMVTAREAVRISRERASLPTEQVDEAMVERALDAYYPTLWPDGLNEKDAADFRVTMRKALEAAIGGSKP